MVYVIIIIIEINNFLHIAELSPECNSENIRTRINDTCFSPSGIERVFKQLDLKHNCIYKAQNSTNLYTLRYFAFVALSLSYAQKIIHFQLVEIDANNELET